MNDQLFDPRDHEAFVREIDAGDYDAKIVNLPKGAIPRRRGYTWAQNDAANGVVTATVDPVTGVIESSAAGTKIIAGYEGLPKVAAQAYPLTSGSAAGGGTTRFNIAPLPFSDEVTRIDAYIQTAGNFTFYVLRAVDATHYSLVKTLFSVSLTTGLKTFTRADFGVVTVAAGDVIAVYSAAGAVAYDTTNGDSMSVIGEPTSLTTFVASSARLHINVTTGKTAGGTFDALSAADDRVKAALDNLHDVVNFGRAAIAGTPVSGVRTIVLNSSPGKIGVLSGINIYVGKQNSGFVRVKVMRPTGSANEFSVVSDEDVTGLVVGLNSIKRKKPVLMQPTDTVGIYSPDLQVAYTSNAGTDLTYSGEAAIGGTVTTEPTTHAWRFNVDVIVKTDTGGTIKPYVFNTSLANALPAGFVQAGGWTHSALGAVAPATGDWDTSLHYDSVSALDKYVFSARVVITNAASIFALVARDLSVSGTAAEVDCSSGNLNIYNGWNESGDPSGVAATVSIGFAIDAGREYQITLKKYTDITSGSASAHKLTLTDPVTQQSAYVTAAYPLGGSGWGKKGIVFRSGAITVRWVSYSPSMPFDAAVGVYGDSLTEGNSIPTAINSRWPELLKADIGDKVFVSGMGGASSSDLLTRFVADYGNFRQKYVVLAIGTNDTILGVWQANVESLAAQVIAKGGVPVIPTLPPRADRQAFLTSANAYILSSGYRYVDFAAALTTNGDRVTWNATYNTGDGTHPSVAGHARMYAQLQIDVPEIFSGAF